MSDHWDIFLPPGLWGDLEVWDDNAFWTDARQQPSLLPQNATGPELAIEQAIAGADGIPVALRDLWRPDACPANLLPWLAWAMSVDEWEPSWPESRKRDVIARSVTIHRRKGTVGAVRDAIAAAGLGGATLLERFGRTPHDGSVDYDGAINHTAPDHWAEYRLTLDKAISVAQAAQVRRIVGSVAPLRSHLKALDFLEAANLYDGAIDNDGTYTHGVA